jgi:hypothetical protein
MLSSSPPRIALSRESVARRPRTQHNRTLNMVPLVSEALVGRPSALPCHGAAVIHHFGNAGRAALRSPPIPSRARSQSYAELRRSASRAICSVIDARVAWSRRRTVLPRSPPSGPLNDSRSVSFVPASPGSIRCSAIIRAPGPCDSLTQRRGGSTRVIVHEIPRAVTAGTPLGLLTIVLPSRNSPSRRAVSITSPSLHRATSTQAAHAFSGLARVTAEPEQESTHGH